MDKDEPASLEVSPAHSVGSGDGEKPTRKMLEVATNKGVKVTKKWSSRIIRDLIEDSPEKEAE